MAAKMAVACGQFALVDTNLFITWLLPNFIYGLLLSNACPSSNMEFV